MEFSIILLLNELKTFLGKKTKIVKRNLIL